MPNLLLFAELVGVGSTLRYNTARRPGLRAIVAAYLLCAAGLAVGGPFVPAGDLGLRHDVQLLADYGVIESPMTSWPMSWEALAHDLANLPGDSTLPAAVRHTMERVKRRVEANSRRNAARFRGGAAFADSPTAIRGFQYTPREDAEASAGFTWLGERLSIDLRATAVNDAADGQDFRADGSEIGLRLGNFTYALSMTDRWWGPGWDGSLILTNNARPIPAFTIRRDVLKPFETKWLSWLGPWDLRAMWGEMESDRVIPDANFFGMRFNFRPHPSLEIGLSRTAQLCGEGRPCGFDVFWDMFWGQDNVGDSGTTPENEPGNQLAGFDFRWSNNWFGTPMAIYAQIIGEDEAGGFPSRYMGMGGVELTAWSKFGGTSFRWFAEVASVSCDAFKSNPSYNCAYNHSIYQTGYRYRGRVVGHGAEGGALITSLGMVMATAGGNHFSALVRSGELNKGGRANNTLTPIPLDIVSADLSYSHNWPNQRLEVGLGYEELDDPASGVVDNDVRAFIQWRWNP